MTNNGLKISEMVYSNIEDAVNNDAQVPVSAEIDGVKVNRRIPIKLITDGLITDNYVEKNPDTQDTQIINSPIKITSLTDTASLIVKGIIEISDTGTQDKNTYNIISMTDTLASSYTCIPNGKANFYSYLNSRGYVMNNAMLRSDDGDGYYSHSITHQDTNTAIITESSVQATKANVYAKNAIQANISNNIAYCSTLSTVYDGTNRVELYELISPSMYRKALCYHGSDLITIFITDQLDNKLIKIDNINVELKSACIIDSYSRCGTEGQVLSSTGTGVAWVNQSSGGGSGPQGISGDIQYNNSGEFGGSGQVYTNTYDNSYNPAFKINRLSWKTPAADTKSIGISRISFLNAAAFILYNSSGTVEICDSDLAHRNIYATFSSMHSAIRRLHASYDVKNVNVDENMGDIEIDNSVVVLNGSTITEATLTASSLETSVDDLNANFIMKIVNKSAATVTFKTFIISVNETCDILYNGNKGIADPTYTLLGRYSNV